MASVRGQEYCDFLFGELNDIKKRLDGAIGRSATYSADVGGFENVSAHLRDIENVIDSKLDVLGKSCPDWKRFEEQMTSGGRYQRPHPERVPYGLTPM